MNRTNKGKDALAEALTKERRTKLKALLDYTREETIGGNINEISPALDMAFHWFRVKPSTDNYLILDALMFAYQDNKRNGATTTEAIGKAFGRI